MSPSLPPPDHYEYAIELDSDLTGRITFWHDYPMNGPPSWRASFEVRSDAFDRVTRAVDAMGDEAGPPAVGGPVQELHADLPGRPRHLTVTGPPPPGWEAVRLAIHRAAPASMRAELGSRAAKFEGSDLVPG